MPTTTALASSIFPRSIAPGGTVVATSGSISFGKGSPAIGRTTAGEGSVTALGGAPGGEESAVVERGAGAGSFGAGGVGARSVVLGRLSEGTGQYSRQATNGVREPSSLSLIRYGANRSAC